MTVQTVKKTGSNVFLGPELDQFSKSYGVEIAKDIENDPYWTTMCVLYAASDDLLQSVDEAKHTRNIEHYVRRSNLEYKDYEERIKKRIRTFANTNVDILDPDREILLMFHCMTKGILYRQYDNTIRTIKLKRGEGRSEKIVLFIWA